MAGQPDKQVQEIPSRLDEVKQYLIDHVGLESSYDLIARYMEIASKKVLFFYVNGFVNDAVMTEIMKRLSYLERGELQPKPLASLLNKYVTFVQVETSEDMHEAITLVLAGASAMFIEGENAAIMIDVKTLPMRSIEEPDLERVVRGSRDGFVETMLTNTLLVRRRIRDPGLRMEVMRLGRRSQTDVCMAYISDITDDELVKAIKQKLKKTDMDGLTLADKQLEELLIGNNWNPYPQVRYTERPDVAATHLLEGHILIFVDTSPSVMILPTTFFHLVQHAEEFRQTPFVGTYLRWVRYLGILASLFLLPLWYLYVANPELKPDALDFLGPNKKANLPILLQFLLAELGVDLVRMAAVHTPTPLASAMGIVAAILIGDIAVQTGLFVNEVILYISVAAVGMFATPSYELSLANRISRLVILVFTAAFKVPGFLISSTVVLLILIVQRSYNSPYMWPFIPFNAKAMATLLLREPFTMVNRRMSLNKTKDSTRRPVKGD